MEATNLGGTMWRVTAPDGSASVVGVRAADNTAAAAIAAVQEAAVPPVPAVQLASRRAGLSCSRLQGRLALGAATCAVIDAIAADPETPWAMREAIANAAEWQRTSQMVTEMAWLLGVGDEGMDALFETAAAIRV